MNPWGSIALEPGAAIVEDGPSGYAGSLKGPDADWFLAMAAQRRYGTRNPVELADRYAKDVGLPNPVAIRTSQRLMPPIPYIDAGRVLGNYDPVADAIRISPALAGDAKRDRRSATALHEISHAADSQETGYSAQTERGAEESPFLGSHHEHYPVNFEAEMAGQMIAQNIIENGGTVHPGFYAQYPWLKDVVPRSSNRLASPWRFNR